jgi:hypothetical protein
MVFLVKAIGFVICFYFICDVVKTYISKKYNKDVIEAERGKKSDSLATYMFRRDDR